jgi:hypothetical protein
MCPPSLAVAFIGLVLVFAGCGGGAGNGSQGQGTQAGDTAPTSETQRQGTEGAEETETDSGSSQSITGDSGSVSQSNRVSGGSSSSFSSSSQTSSGGHGLRSFSGQGETNLTFDVEQPSRLSWTNDEDETFSARGAGINVDSRRGRGEINLEPGHYSDVHVRGATWTIVVRPR